MSFSASRSTWLKHHPRRTSWTDAQTITGVITMLFFCCILPTWDWNWNLDLPINWLLYLQLHPLLQIPSLSKTQHTIGELSPFSRTTKDRPGLFPCMPQTGGLEDCSVESNRKSENSWDTILVYSTVISGGSLLNFDTCVFDACFTAH